MRDDAIAQGRLRILLLDSAMGGVHEIDTHNLVTNAGLVWLVQSSGRLVSTSIAMMAIGTSSQAPDGGDSHLYAEVARVNVSDSTSGATFTLNAQFGEGDGTGSITEFGLFLNDGTLIARSVIPPQTKSPTTTMQVQWTITLQSA